jgi:hypothetical protein
VPDDELKRLADVRLDALRDWTSPRVAAPLRRRCVARLRTPLAIIKTNPRAALTDKEGTDESRARAAAVIERAIAGWRASPTTCSRWRALMRRPPE